MSGYSAAVGECLNVYQQHYAGLVLSRCLPVLMGNTSHGCHTIQLSEKMPTDEKQVICG